MSSQGMVFCDISYWQTYLTTAYPHPWIAIRVSDGTYFDAHFTTNIKRAANMVASGQLKGVTIYTVYRPASIAATVALTKKAVNDALGYVPKWLTVMVDVESWGGQVKGNQSTGINNMIKMYASWLGSRKRVIAYGNYYDLKNLWPTKPSDTKLILAAYTSKRMSIPNMIAQQYSDGSAKYPVPTGLPRSSKPFGPCDHNIAWGMTPTQFAIALGVASALPDPTGGGVPVPPYTPTETDMPKYVHLGHTQPQTIKADTWTYVLWDHAYADPDKMFHAVGSGAIQNVAGRPMNTTFTATVAAADAAHPLTDIRTRPVYIKPIANAPDVGSALETLEHLTTDGNTYLIDTRALGVQAGKYMAYSIYVDEAAVLSTAGFTALYW